MDPSDAEQLSVLVVSQTILTSQLLRPVLYSGPQTKTSLLAQTKPATLNPGSSGGLRYKDESSGSRKNVLRAAQWTLQSIARGVAPLKCLRLGFVRVWG